VLVGHSIGAYHTLAWALTRPGQADGIILLGAGIGFRQPDARARYNAVMERSAAAFGVHPRVTRLALVPDDLVIDGLPTLDVPVLALVGRDDHVRFHKAAAYLAARASQAVYRQVPGGHEAQLEYPAAVTAAIEAFARAIIQTRGDAQ
jgi:pimeloyl-ACP methyl ester carboxylesterase